MAFTRPGAFSIYSLIIMLFIVGCNSGDTAIAPELDENPEIGHAVSAERILWGMYYITIDPESLTAEVVPLRRAEFTCNVTRFMQPPISPTHLVHISIDPSSNPENGYFVVDVNLKHPFPGINMYTGFDVRGILFAQGSLYGIHDSSLVRSDIDETRCNNPDGYTRWWNWIEFTSFNTLFGVTKGKLAPPDGPNGIANPYKYFADDLELTDSVTSLDPNSRGAFTTYGSNTRRYEIQFEMKDGQPVFFFNYAIDASWEQPDPSFAPDYPLEAFNYSANCQEAFHVEITDAGSTAYYVDDQNHGGELILDIEIFDWQGGANGDVPAEISGIFLEGDILGGAVEIASPTILSGSTMNSSIYEVELGPLNLTGPGEFEIFATIESSDPDTYMPQIPGGEAFDFPDAHLAAYVLFSVNVIDGYPYNQPTVTNVDPDEGIPDCTSEHVTVKGADFIDGATFHLEMVGQPDIVAENIAFIDENTLVGDLTLTGAESGEWDVTVENMPGFTGTLEEGFTVLEVVYVDGDNNGDPDMDGSMDHPFDTIQDGVDWASMLGCNIVIIDQSELNYEPFTLHENSHVIGCNWNDGVGWATVEQVDEFIYEYHINNITIEGLHFDITRNQMPGPIVTDHIGMQFVGGQNITFRSCKFTGEITNQGSSWFIKLHAISNLEVSHCEFTEIYRRGPETSYRGVFILSASQVNGFHLHHSEFHNIGFDQPDTGVGASRITVISAGTITNDIDIHNVLIYDIYDKTNGVGMYHGNSITALQCPMNAGTYFNLYNITIDDIRQADPPGETTVDSGTAYGMYMFAPHVPRNWKNNIVSNIIATDEAVIPGWSSYYGYYCEGTGYPPPFPQPMDNSAVFNVAKPLPDGAPNGDGWYYGWEDQVTYGEECIFNFEDKDPAYDLTPGANFYHPTNPDYATGADDGTEMGAFGGPEGDWIPPSQLY